MIYRIVERKVDNSNIYSYSEWNRYFKYILIDYNQDKKEEIIIQIAKKKVLDKIDEIGIDKKTNVDSLLKMYRVLRRNLYL